MHQYADVETSTDSYATRFSGTVGRWFLERQSQIVLAHLWTHTETQTILEVGGGHGQLTYPCSAHGYTVTTIGSDSSCEHRIKELSQNGFCHFVSGDLLSLPFPDKSFDSVTCIRLLSHCDRWPDLIRELCRVSKTQVIVDYPPLRSFNILYRFLYRLKKGAEGTTRPFTIFQDSDIEGAFLENGFILEKRSPQFFLPMVIYRKLKSACIGKILEGCFNRLQITDIFGSPTISSFIRKSD